MLRLAAATSSGSPGLGEWEWVRGDILSRLAATDRFHSELGLELGTVGAPLVHRWEASSGRRTALEVNDGGCPEKPDHLTQG